MYITVNEYSCLFKSIALKNLLANLNVRAGALNHHILHITVKIYDI